VLTWHRWAKLIVDVGSTTGEHTGGPGESGRHDLEGRTYLITGASSGIGRTTALALGRRGATLLLAGRSAASHEAVTAEIEALDGPASAEVLLLDLADLASVRACAEAVLARDQVPDVIINNAGLAGRKGVTAQGFELTFGVNHLGHFLLTTLLLDRLRGAGRPTRVVTVASDAHRGPKRIDFDAQVRRTRSFGALKEYQVSKLCNVLFTQELARRLEGSDVTAYAVHPGVVASNIWRQVPWPIRPIALRFMITAEEGALCSVHCATAPGIEPLSGSYFEKGEVKEPSAVATPELGAELWKRSEEWVAL
jgi:NAD(P)-dependent dehydrogenase (short-subunit alcohol dehydrogenase family)